MIKLHGEFEIDFIKKILKLGMTDRQTAGKTAMESNNSPPPHHHHQISLVGD